MGRGGAKQVPGVDLHFKRGKEKGNEMKEGK